MKNDILEYCYDIIKEEALEIVKTREVRDDVTRTQAVNLSMINYKNYWVKGWTYNPNWINYGYIYNGWYLHPDDKITKILKEWEIINNRKIAMAGLSLLKAGGVIPEHTDTTQKDPVNNVIHMGLDVPEGCWLNLNGEKIFEADKKIISFNDFLKHSAYNTSTRDRLILYFKY